MVTQNWVNFGLGNDFLSEVAQRSPEPMMTNQCDIRMRVISEETLDTFIPDKNL